MTTEVTTEMAVSFHTVVKNGAKVTGVTTDRSLATGFAGFSS